MQDAVNRLWPELQWINDADLRQKVTQTWVRALKLSPLTAEDLDRILFTLASQLPNHFYGTQALCRPYRAQGGRVHEGVHGDGVAD